MFTITIDGIAVGTSSG